MPMLEARPAPTDTRPCQVAVYLAGTDVQITTCSSHAMVDSLLAGWQAREQHAHLSACPAGLSNRQRAEWERGYRLAWQFQRDREASAERVA